jgi:hypothetical protein
MVDVGLLVFNRWLDTPTVWTCTKSAPERPIR